VFTNADLEVLPVGYQVDEHLVDLLSAGKRNLDRLSVVSN
jgi:hypothetical protein